jgi:hypothetical protein
MVRELKDSDAAILLLIYSTALGAEWTVWWSGGGRRGTAVPSHVPRPNHARRKKEVFFFGASPLNAQWSPDFGHKNGIIATGATFEKQREKPIGISRSFGKKKIASSRKKNSGENGGTHGSRSLFVESLVVSENVGKVAYKLS